MTKRQDDTPKDVTDTDPAPSEAASPDIAPETPPTKAEVVAPPEEDERTRLIDMPLPPEGPDLADGLSAVDEDDERTQFVAIDPSAAFSIPPMDPGPGATEQSVPPVSNPGPASPQAEPLQPVPLPQSGQTQVEVPPGSPVRAGKIGVGTEINNNYRITDVLKSGGMGEVYRGIEIGTGDPVAIKAILPELAEDEKAGLLFKREARTLRQLSDDAIVRYYNYVHDRALNRYFLVMEFIEGVPLSDQMAKLGPMPVMALEALIARLAKGLAKAHAQGVVHRDLSPDNVMLPGGAVQDARLIDFGIAKSNVVQSGTMAGQFAGKLKYVAPEQLGHFGGEIGPAADVYGLALMIAAAARGKPLDMGSSIVEAVQSRQSIPDLSSLPEALQPLLRHMLEPDPQARPASMQEVVRLLEDPALIPVPYFAGARPPAPKTMAPGSAQSAAMITTPPKGLQVPLGTMTPMAPANRVGAQTAAGANLPTHAALGHSATTTADVDDHPPSRSGGILLGMFALVFVAVLGSAGWYAWSKGMLGGKPDLHTAEQTAGTSDDEAQPGMIPAPIASSREGFLAGFDTGACSFNTRITSGANAGMIEGFSTQGSSFAGLPVAYEEAFGARPDMLPRRVAPAQCAALDFARALQGRGRSPADIRLSTDQAESGVPLRADLAVAGTQAVWTALISPKGGVYNLSGQWSDPIGGQRSMSFGLTLANGAEAAPQLILTVTSDTPLVRAAAATNGAQAAELLPYLLEEVAGRGGAAAATLSYVLLTPPGTAGGTEGETVGEGNVSADAVSDQASVTSE